MKRKVFLNLFLLLTVFWGFNVNAQKTTVYNVSNPIDICNKVKGNQIKVYVAGETRTYLPVDDSGKCENTRNKDATVYSSIDDYYNNAAPWTFFGMFKTASTSTFEYTKEGRAIDDTTNYVPFVIANNNATLNKNGTINTYKSLKSKQSIGIEFILDEAIDLSDMTDLRISFDYGISSESGDYDIYQLDSMAITLVDTGGYYHFPENSGIYYQELSDRYNYNVVGSTTQYTMSKYHAVSYNLIGSNNQNKKIKKFRILPYYKYTIRGDSEYFRLFNVKLDSYNRVDESDTNIFYARGFHYKNVNTSGVDYGVSSFNNVTRSKIVNNMVDISTIKWKMNSTNPTLHFFNAYNITPRVYDPSDNTIYYGVPYVNNGNYGLEKFLEHTTKIASSNDAIYEYSLPTKYVKDANTFSGGSVTGGTEIGSDLYLHEGITLHSEDEKLAELNSHPYIANSNGNYFVGSDCAKSTFAATLKEIPTLSTLANSNDYYYNADVYMLGDIELSTRKIENFIRNKGAITNTTPITRAIYKQYYSSVYKNKVNVQDIYKAYAQTYPGDMISKVGHARIVTGRTVVVCVDNNSNGTPIWTDDFLNNSTLCDEKNGIDGERSYVVVSEIVNNYVTKTNINYAIPASTTAIADGSIKAKTAFPLTFNSDLTDVESVENYYSKNRTFRLNKIYTFNKLLYNTDSDPEGSSSTGCTDPDGIDTSGNLISCDNGTYFPFRYKIMDERKDEYLNSKNIYVDNNRFFYPKVKTTDKVTIEEFDADKSLRGIITSNYKINVVKVKIESASLSTPKVFKFIPKFTNNVSLWSNISKENGLGAGIGDSIRSLNAYSNEYKVTVSIQTGPEESAYQYSNYTYDDEGYIQVLSIEKKNPTSVAVSSTSATINKGATKTLTATVAPSGSFKTVTWTSSDTSVATVSSDGVVTAKKAGTVTIMATAAGGATATCEVIVVVPVTGVTLSSTSATMNKGATKTLTATVAPSNATNKTVTWSSSNINVATVSNAGVVTAVGAGTATITVTTEDGNKIATCEVMVAEKLPFTDTKEGAWYYESVKGAYTRGIIKGYDNGKFGVNDKITRGQLVVILYRLEDETNVSTYFNPFEDVKAGAYYENAIRWGYANHIINGYNEVKFGPNDNIKRKDFAVILNNYAKYKSLSVNGSADLTSFADYYKVEGNYSEPAMKWAVANTIINGAEKDGKRYLNPNDNATRAEASAMIMNFINKYNL